jgi:hypothetical protein
VCVYASLKTERRLLWAVRPSSRQTWEESAMHMPSRWDLQVAAHESVQCVPNRGSGAGCVRDVSIRQMFVIHLHGINPFYSQHHAVAA